MQFPDIRFVPGWRTTLFPSTIRCGDTKTVRIFDFLRTFLHHHYLSSQASRPNDPAHISIASSIAEHHPFVCLATTGDGDEAGSSGFQKQFSTAPGINHAAIGTFTEYLTTLTSNKSAHSPMVYSHSPMVYARPFGLCIAFASGSLTHHSYQTFLPSLIRQNCTAS